jgi:hypothetical protein
VSAPEKKRLRHKKKTGKKRVKENLSKVKREGKGKTIKIYYKKI